jgi:hypothetical protein
MSHGWVFTASVMTSGYNISMWNTPPELKQVALQIVQNQFDRDTAEKNWQN